MDFRFQTFSIYTVTFLRDVLPNFFTYLVADHISQLTMLSV